jgi:hypothetical protein
VGHKLATVVIGDGRLASVWGRLSSMSNDLTVAPAEVVGPLLTADIRQAFSVDLGISCRSDETSTELASVDIVGDGGNRIGTVAFEFANPETLTGRQRRPS